MADTPVAIIDETGLHLPTFDDCLSYFLASYQSVYGVDVSADNSTQDYQWISLQATALHDANAMIAAVYNAFSPSTAQGAGLSSVIKINGLARNIATYSTVSLKLIGQAGTLISGGIASDAAGNKWALPSSVMIPLSGEITVSATASEIGAITADPGSVTNISTPTFGWQSVTNPTAATVGAPVELDPALRLRQSASTALPALSVLDGMVAALSALGGVARLAVFENDANLPSEDGIPGHAIAVVIDGGDDALIAQTISLKKGPGAGTYGTSTQTITNAYGIPRQVSFFRPARVPITVKITIKALSGFTAATQANIQSAVADYINTLAIGDDLLLDELYVPARLNVATTKPTYRIASILAARSGKVPTSADVAMAFNEAAFSKASYVSITVTTS